MRTQEDLAFELAQEPLLGSVTIPGNVEGKDFIVEGKKITLIGDKK